MKIIELLNRFKTRDSYLEDALDEIYIERNVADHYTRALVTFAERFPEVCEVSVLRAPGRVNLIGEHTDYNGLPVFPMAIDHDIIVVYSPRTDNLIRIVNPEFPDRTFALENHIQRYASGDWGNYVKAGVQGLINELGGHDGMRGFNACFYGTVPTSAGLSSSSCLVVASGMVLLDVSGVEMDKLKLAECMARAEWYSGIECGAMDQAISILGERGKALKIDFFPLAVKPVSLPEGYTVVVANSMVQASKTLNARMSYNTRHAVCRMAAALLTERAGLAPEKIKRLGDVYYNIGEDRIGRVLKENLYWHGYDKVELSEGLKISQDQLNSKFCTTAEGDYIHEPPEGFRVLARARHVVSEAARVEDAVRAVESGDVSRFGRLMNESHESCRDNYEISHPALEDLVDISREAGAIGSRLTGAGFGGCTVNLVEDGILDDFLGEVGARYFDDALKSYPEAYLRWQEKTSPALLKLKPSAGARVLFR